MSDWYCAPANGQQPQGPFDDDALIARYRSGEIGMDTLVWRDGQPQWQPLNAVAERLGLTLGGAQLPPPLPPAWTPAPARPIAALAQPAPRSGLSGCMIALIVAAVLAIPILGILAAIALPAYQDYTLRARVAGALPTAEPVKNAVARYLAGSNTCPSNSEGGFGSPESYASGNVASVTIGEFDSNQCGMELILRGTGNDKLDGKALWFEYDAAASTWQCSSEIDDRYLPPQCRG